MNTAPNLLRHIKSIRVEHIGCDGELIGTGQAIQFKRGGPPNGYFDWVRQVKGSTAQYLVLDGNFNLPYD